MTIRKSYLGKLVNWTDTDQMYTEKDFYYIKLKLFSKTIVLLQLLSLLMICIMSLVMGVVPFSWPGLDFTEKFIDWMNEMDLEDRNKDISENSQEKDLRKVVEWVNDIDLKDRKEDFTEHSQDNKLAKLIVLPSALKGTEGCRRHKRTIYAMKGNKDNEAH